MGRGVRGRVAYVVAVIGQEKTRDQATRRVTPLRSCHRPIDRKQTETLPAAPLFSSLPSTTRKSTQKYRISVVSVAGSVFNIHVRTDHSPCPKPTANKSPRRTILFLQIILS